MKLKLPLPKKLMKKKGVIVGGIILVLIVAVFLGTRGGEAVEVKSQVVDQGAVFKTIDETAVVKSYNERIIDALVAAELVELKVAVGDVVAEGDTLAVLDVKDVEFQLKQLEAQKKSLQAQLADVSNVDKEELERSMAQVRSAQASLNDADRSLESNTRLYELGAVSKDAYETAVNDQIMKKEALEVASQSYELLKKGISKELKSKYLADIEALDYQIGQLEYYKGKYAITAPFNGIVTDKFVAEGELVVAGQDLFEVSDTDMIYLETDVLSSDMAMLKPGTRVLVDDEDLNLLFDAKITKIHPKAFSKTSDLGIEQKRVIVEMEALEKQSQLKLGYEMDINIIEEERNDVVRIPDSAAFKLNGLWHVFVIQNDKAVLTPVEVGLEGRDYYEVLDGLAVDAVVVDSPTNDLVDEASVTINNADSE